MLSMTEHDERPTRVQEELWYLINDEDVKQVLEAMIDKMKTVEESLGRIKSWRQEAKAYIPDDQKYEENYWVAAYILYNNLEKFKELFDKLDKINSELGSLKNELDKLKDEQEYIIDIIKTSCDDIELLIDEDKYDEDVKKDEEISDLIYDIQEYTEELEDARKMYKETLNRLCKLKKEKKELLQEIMEVAEQLIVS